MSKRRVTKPFRFFTRLNLVELTGIKAKNAEEFLEFIKKVPGSVIYHHTHHFLQQHLYLSPEPPNDFAYWLSNVLQDVRLGEQVASIDTCEYSKIRDLRNVIIDKIESHIKSGNYTSRNIFPGMEFHFFKSISFILPTGKEAHTLGEFRDVLKEITIHSIYLHMFESRLRLGRGTNDFSFWIERNLKEKKLAEKISAMDPYTHTLEGLRKKLIAIINRYLRRKRGNG